MGFRFGLRSALIASLFISVALGIFVFYIHKLGWETLGVVNSQDVDGSPVCIWSEIKHPNKTPGDTILVRIIVYKDSRCFEETIDTRWPFGKVVARESYHGIEFSNIKLNELLVVNIDTIHASTSKARRPLRDPASIP